MGVNSHQNADGSVVLQDDISGRGLMRAGGPDAGTVASPRFSVPHLAKMAITGGTDTGGGILSWINPALVPIIVQRIYIDVTVVASSACSISAGTTIVSATTSAANLIDTLDVHSATGLFDNITDKGSGGKSKQRLAVGGWVTISQASGASAALVGNVYIEYTQV